MQKTGESTDHCLNTGSFFSIDEAGAKRCCSNASVALQANDIDQFEALALQALCLRPSSMLAYSLLSQHYQMQGQAELAQLCQNGTLPENLLDRLSQGLSFLRTAALKCGRSRFERSTIHAAEQIEMPEPLELASTTPGSEIPFSNERVIKAGAAFIDTIDGGVVWHDTRHTLVWDSTSAEITEHTVADRSMISAFAYAHKPFHIKGRAFLIGARGVHNFYHWMADITPRLGLLKSAGFNFVASDRFIVAHADASFSIGLLRAFGVSSEQIYATEKEHPYLSADQLIVPFMNNKMGLTMGRWVPQVMRSALLTGSANNSVLDRSRRIFIHRASGSSDGRRIVNQDETLTVLEQAGFESVQTDKLTVAQQAQLFSEASVVVAAHGAGLSNIMFCKPGARVIELYANHLAPCYRSICALCDLQYCRLYCGNENLLEASQGSESVKRSTNLAVPLNTLVKALG